MVLVAASILLAQMGAGAWSGGRPPECPGTATRIVNVWERAKSPELRRYCDLVASALSKLAGTATMAQAALDAAREAESLLPGRAATRVLEGRAFAALGQTQAAFAAFRSAKEIDERALQDPASLLSWARVLARLGHSEEAALAYMALLPEGGSLPSADRASAAAEAGLVEISLGASRLDASAAALRESMRIGPDDTEGLAVLALALALDRQGSRAQAHALLSDRARVDAHAVMRAPRVQEIVAVAPREAPALLAIGSEAVDPVSAREAWEAYVAANPGGPWVAHARTHLADLAARADGRPIRRRTP